MPKAPAPPPAPRPAPSPSLPAGPEHYHFSPTGELLPRASLLDTQALSQEAPTSLLRGLTNLFLVCVFWLVAGEVCGEACTTSGGPPTATAYLGRFLSHSLALPLLAEGLAALLAISALWLLAAYCAVGCAFPYASAASTAAQAIGVSALLLGVPLWVRCCTPTWPFLQRLALCMAAGVQALKLWSLCETNRALQREVLGGQGAGEGECVEAVLAHAQPPAPPAFAGPLPDGAQWALARHPWPQRATLGTFASHLLSPNIVFVPNLPRRSHIRLAYISEKLVLGLLLTLVATHVHEGFLVPLWAGAARIHSPAHFFRSFLATVNPIAFVTGCLFLIVFECITVSWGGAGLCAPYLPSLPHARAPLHPSPHKTLPRTFARSFSALRTGHSTGTGGPPLPLSTFPASGTSPSATFCGGTSTPPSSARAPGRPCWSPWPSALPCTRCSCALPWAARGASPGWQFSASSSSH